MLKISDSVPIIFCVFSYIRDFLKSCIAVLNLTFPINLYKYFTFYENSISIFLIFQIKYGAMACVMIGNFFIFLTILLFFTVFDQEDEFGF